jgi:AraC-like DNA-binding protein
MIFILALLTNVLQPFGLANNHEFHKPLVLFNYILVFYAIYALLYTTLSYFRPHHYHPDTWTIKKEFNVLLYNIPPTASITCLYACISVPEFELNLPMFIQLQFYNSMLSMVSIPAFGYLIDTRLNPTTIALRRKRKEINEKQLNLNEKQSRAILKKIDQLMETEKLYLSYKCSLQQVSTLSGIPLHHISYVINTYTEYSFSDFVNKYRVEHVCHVLQNGYNKKLTLEAIGAECGFGSKVSFYSAFRKFTGTTPAEYCLSSNR